MPRMLSTRNSFQLWNAPATDDMIRAAAPSVFAPAPHPNVSENYGFVSTVSILNAMRSEGWAVYGAGQSRSRDAERTLTTKHMLRLRHQSASSRALQDADGVAEAIYIGSHDGSGRAHLMGGYMRFVCLNGMVVGENIAAAHIRHTGSAIERALEETYALLSNLGRVVESRDKMRAVQLTHDQRDTYAAEALSLKYPYGGAPIDAWELLKPRRVEDYGGDLWTVFNRVQENLIRGGQQGFNAKGKRASTRGVQSIDRSNVLNRDLWDLTERTRRALTGEVSVGETLALELV